MFVYVNLSETDKHFDDAFIEDSDQNNTTLDHSSETIINKSMRCLKNSSIATKEKIAADCQGILHWPLEDRNSVNCSESSSENCLWETAAPTPKSTDKNCIWEIAGFTPKSTDKNCIWEMAGITPKSADKKYIWEIAGITPKSTDKKCIWEIAGITPKSTDKTVCEPAKQDILMDYSTTAMSPPGLKESPSTISVATKNCSVKVRDILLTYIDSPSKKTGSFSSSLRSLALGETVSANIPQSQPLKSTLLAQNDSVNDDNHCRGARKVDSFCGKKLQTKPRSVKKRAWKQKDGPRKRKCLDPSITTVPPVSLKDSPSRILLDSKEGPITDKSLLTSVTLPSSILAQSLPLNSPLETNNDIVNTVSWIKNKRICGPISEKKPLAESMKAVKKWTKNVPRKRRHMGQLVDETFALSQFVPETETCVVKFPLHSDETVYPSLVKNMFICNKTIQTNAVSDDAPSASGENLQLIPWDPASSNSDTDKRNCLWDIYSGKKLLSPQNSNGALPNEAREPSNDDNAVLAEELKNWEPFSTNAFSKTVGAMTQDAEVALQDTVASGTCRWNL